APEPEHVRRLGAGPERRLEGRTRAARDEGAPAEGGEADEACGEVARVAVRLLVHNAPPRGDSGRRRLGRKSAALEIGEPELPIVRLGGSGMDVYRLRHACEAEGSDVEAAPRG